MASDVEEKIALDILVAGTGSLLHQAITNLILREPGFQVATITGNDPAALLLEMETVRPDVILLCEADPFDQTQLFEIFKQVPIHEPLRVIIVYHETNAVEVYDKQSIQLNHNANADLITLIKDR